MTEQEYLKKYDPGKYEKPSVTTDILIFTMDTNSKLEVLLIKRGGHPYLGKWALPGGFVGINESLEEAAKRELREETGLKGDYHLEQLYTFGKVDRDPRMRVISVAYMALIPKGNLSAAAGDDASDARFFNVSIDNWELCFTGNDHMKLTADDLAFDHKDIIMTGLKRLSGKLDYTDLAFELVADKKKFTIGELQKIHESIKGRPLDPANFRRSFKKKYLDTGLVTESEQELENTNGRPSKSYRFLRP